MKFVSDYMIRKIVSINADKPLADAIKLMKDSKIGSILVKEGADIVGIFTERDLLNRVDFAKFLGSGSIKIKDVMTKDLKTVAHDESYTKVIELMQKYKIRHMPVAKEGNIIGIVSLRDLLNCHQQYLEHTIKEREAELREDIAIIQESEERFRSIFNNSAVGITFVDRDERIIAWNPYAAELLEMGEEDLLNKPVKVLYPPEEWKRIRSKNIRQLGSHHYLETKIINKQGECLDVDISISVLKDRHGDIIGSIGIMRDITERKRLERIREEFAGVVSHELRTPLIPIREGVSQVLEGLLGPVSNEQKEFLSIAVTEIDRLKRIIDNLLDMFRLESGKVKIKKELVDVKALAKDVVSTFLPRAKSKGLDIKVKFPKDPLMIYIDRDRSIQVFANLIGNSVKFTKKGFIEVCITDKKNNIECIVSDTGRGIAQRDLSKLFNKFQRFGKTASSDESGTGLGLAICKDIIELHKGSISVESRLNKGSKFTFTLPKYPAKEIFKECVIDGLGTALEKDEAFSVLTFEIKDFDAIQKKLDKEKLGSVVQILESLVKSNLRYMKDIVIKDKDKIFAVLPSTVQDGALAVRDRIKQAVDDYLAKEQLNEDIKITYKAANSPNDGTTAKELFSKINEPD